MRVHVCSSRNRAVAQLFLFVFTASFVCAQAPFAQLQHWRPISPEELKLSDKTVPAIILYRELIMDDNHRTDWEFYRIKILTEAGKTHGNVEIPFIPGVMEIEDISARSVDPTGKVTPWQGPALETTVVRKKKVKVLVKKVVLPEVGVGTIIEYGYKVHWKKQFRERDWDLQGDLFTREAFFAFYPARLPYMSISWASIACKANINQDRTKDQYRFTAEIDNIPQFEAEEFMPAEEDVRARIRFVYRPTFGNPYFWSDLADVEREFYRKFIGRSRDIENEAVRIVASAPPTDEGKLRALYARAQQIRHTDLESAEQRKHDFQENKSAEDVLHHGYGTGREINAFFVALARAAGFDAQIVVLMPRTNGRFSSAMDISGLTHQIVWMSDGTYLNPGARYCPYGLLPWYETASGGLRLLDGIISAMTVETPPPSNKDAGVLRRLDLQLDESGRARGTMSVEFSGQDAFVHRSELIDSDEASRKKHFTDAVKEWLPDSAQVDFQHVRNLEDAEKPLVAELAVDIPDLASVTGKRLLFPLSLFRSRKRVFVSERRFYAVEFPYPYRFSDEVTLRLPERYTVESLPSNSPSPFAGADYHISAELKDRTLIIRRHVEVQKFFYPNTAYPVLRSFYQEVAERGDQQVVLSSGKEAASAAK